MQSCQIMEHEETKDSNSSQMLENEALEETIQELVPIFPSKCSSEVVSSSLL